MGYDADRDAAELGRPLEEWADYGFLVGLSGSRSRRIGHEYVARSTAFFSVFTLGLGVPSTTDPVELNRRLAYGEQVQDALHASETAALARRYRRLSAGMYARLAMQVGVLCLTALIAIWWSEPLAIGFLVACFLGSALFGIAVSSRDDVLYGLALGVPSEPIRLPWHSSRASMEI